MTALWLMQPIFNDGRLYTYQNACFLFGLVVLLSGWTLCFSGWKAFSWSWGLTAAAWSALFLNRLHLVERFGFYGLAHFVALFTVCWFMVLLWQWPFRKLRDWLAPRLNGDARRWITVLSGVLIILSVQYSQIVSGTTSWVLAPVAGLAGLLYQLRKDRRAYRYPTYPQLWKLQEKHHAE